MEQTELEGCPTLPVPSPQPLPAQKTMKERPAAVPTHLPCPAPCWDCILLLKCDAWPAGRAATLARVCASATHPLAVNIYQCDSAATAQLLPSAPLTSPQGCSSSRLSSAPRSSSFCTEPRPARLAPVPRRCLLPSWPARGLVEWKEMQMRGQRLPGRALPLPSMARSKSPHLAGVSFLLWEMRIL